MFTMKIFMFKFNNSLQSFVAIIDIYVAMFQTQSSMARKKPSRNQGCHLAFFKAKSAKFGLFWNCLPEIKRFGHLAVFWPFLNVDKKSIF